MFGNVKEALDFAQDQVSAARDAGERLLLYVAPILSRRVFGVPPEVAAPSCLPASV